MKAGEAVPTIFSLTLAIGVTTETCYAWAKEPDKAEFCYILGTIMAKQARALVNRNLVGEFSDILERVGVKQACELDAAAKARGLPVSNHRAASGG